MISRIKKMMLNGPYKQTFSDKNRNFQTKTEIFRQNQTFSDKNRRFWTKRQTLSDSKQPNFEEKQSAKKRFHIKSLVPQDLNLPVKRATTITQEQRNNN